MLIVNVKQADDFRVSVCRLDVCQSFLPVQSLIFAPTRSSYQEQKMNLSGILVVADRNRQAEVISSLDALPGVGVHQIDEPSGRLIAVQEAADIYAEVEGLRRIKALPHVVMAEMVYHYIAEDDAVYPELPPELAAQETSCAVPAYLID
jgi:nitrate reductase NapD